MGTSEDRRTGRLRRALARNMIGDARTAVLHPVLFASALPRPQLHSNSLRRRTSSVATPATARLLPRFEKSAPMRTRQPSGAPAGRLPSVSRSPGSRPLVSPVPLPTPVLAGAVVLPARPHGDQAVASARARRPLQVKGSSYQSQLLDSAPVSLGRAHQRLVSRRSTVVCDLL